MFQNLKFKIEYLLEYGLYLLVFLLPIQTRYIARNFEIGQGNLKGILEYNNISLYGADILLIILLILWAIIFFQSKNNQPASKLGDHCSGNEPHPGPLPSTLSINSGQASSGQALDKERGFLLLLAGLEAFIFVSIFFAPDKVLALYRYGVFLLGIGLAFLIVKADYNFNKLLWSFFSGVFLSAGLGIWQFLNQECFADKWLGLAAHKGSDLGASVIEAAGAGGVLERWLRAYGSFDHPNILGGVLAISLIFLVCYFVIPASIRQLAEESIFNAQNNTSGSRVAARDDMSHSVMARKNYLFYLFFFIFSLALIFSFSRTAWLSFAAAFIFLFIINIWQKNYPAIKKLSGLAVLSIVLLALVFTSYNNLFLTRTGNSGRLEIKSASERKLYIEDAKKVIKKNWLFGAGVGNYANEIIKINSKRYAWEIQPPHNTFVLIWAEIGLLGLLSFIAILGCLAWQGIKNKNFLSLSIISALVIIMIFDHWLWGLHFGVLFFWLIIGIMIKNLKKIYGKQ